MTRLIAESYSGGAPVWTAAGNADVSLSEVRDSAHSLLPECQNPQCRARRFDPLLGYCRLCAIEARIHGETAALAATGDPEGTQIYGHLKTAKYPEPEKKKRIGRSAAHMARMRAAKRRTA